MISELSDTELACIGDNPEKLVRSLARPGSAPREEQAKLIGCLDDETLARIFLAGFVPGPGPLSQETSDCVRAGFEIIDPRTVMTAGIEGDPGTAMAGSMAALSVTMACLNDEEWGMMEARLAAISVQDGDGYLHDLALTIRQTDLGQGEANRLLIRAWETAALGDRPGKISKISTDG